MHVATTQALWLFFDVNGNTQRILSLGVTEVSEELDTLMFHGMVIIRPNWWPMIRTWR